MQPETQSALAASLVSRQQKQSILENDSGRMQRKEAFGVHNPDNQWVNEGHRPFRIRVPIGLGKHPPVGAAVTKIETGDTFCRTCGTRLRRE